jgi:hypothetical protein
LIELMTVHGNRTRFGIAIGRSLFGKERAMKRAIVAFMVVAGLALMMVGCGPEPATPEKKGAGATTVNPMTPPAKKAPAPEGGDMK